MQKTYILGPGAAERMKAPWLTKPSIPLAVYGGIAAIGLLLLAILVFPFDWKFLALAVGALTVLIVVIFAIWWIARHFLEKDIERRASSLRLVVDSEGLVRQQVGLPDVRVAFAEISILDEHPEHGLHVRTSDSFRHIFIPIDLVGYDELRTQLSQWKQPVRRSRRWLGILGGTVGIGYLLAWDIIRNSHDPRVIVSVAALLTTYMLWSLYRTWRSPEIRRLTKLFLTSVETVGLVALFRLVIQRLP